ncbi:CHAT domain-containing protein [Streptomyces sp. NPDC048269]|uniref:CHAT domain-containing protein n=1 Tax=Streptomyces sp. NPDC048269 TaxID=3155753 RepID=UPI00342D2F04
MSTILIHVGDPQSQGFPEDVYVDDGSDPEWFVNPRARKFIPSYELAQCPGLMDDGIQADDLLSTGRDLFGALLSGSPAEVWEAATSNRDSRMVLDIEPSDLRSLPWELLCTPEPQEHWLFENEASPCVRARIPFAMQTEPLTGPVRLLVIMGDPDDEVLKGDRELEAIYTGLSNVPCCWQVHVLRAPDMEKTRQALADFTPHILHFIGHGKQSSAGPSLEIMAPDQPWDLSAGFIAGVLTTPLRLAVLNACRTSGADPQQVVWGLSDAFFERETLAVVAMQGDIASVPAVRFSREFYGQLAAGRALDEATAHARNRLHWVNGGHPRDGAMPVLTVQADPSVILKWPQPIDHLTVTKMRGQEFEGPRWLVGRGMEHHEIMERLASMLTADKADLLAVTGDSEAGKSELTRSCLLTSIWCGVPVVYVNLMNKGNLNLQGLLKEIKDAVAHWLGPKAERPVTTFTQALQAKEDLVQSLREGQPLAATAPGVALPPLNDRPRDAVAYEKSLLNDFALFLQAVTHEPILLILDHVLRCEPYGHVVENLLKPAAAGDFDPVRIVAVDCGLDAKLGAQLVDRVRTVRTFDRSEAKLLVREYCARKRDFYRGQRPDEESWTAFVKSMRARALEREGEDGEYFSPKELVAWEQMAYTFRQVQQ